MNSRRGFLGFLASAVATATLDPERLLWVPGQKLISIPSPTVAPLFSPEEVMAAMLEQLRPKIRAFMESRPSSFTNVFGPRRYAR